MLVTLKIKCKQMWSQLPQRHKSPRCLHFVRNETFARAAKKLRPHTAVQVCFLPIRMDLTRLHYFIFKVRIKQNPRSTTVDSTGRDHSCKEPEPYCNRGSSCKTSTFSKPWLGYGGEELGYWYYCLGDRFSSILATKLQREISISQWSIDAYHIQINS